MTVEGKRCPYYGEVMRSEAECGVMDVGGWRQERRRQAEGRWYWWAGGVSVVKVDGARFVVFVLFRTRGGFSSVSLFVSGKHAYFPLFLPPTTARRTSADYKTLPVHTLLHTWKHNLHYINEYTNHTQNAAAKLQFILHTTRRTCNAILHARATINICEIQQRYNYVCEHKEESFFYYPFVPPDGIFLI